MDGLAQSVLLPEPVRVVSVQRSLAPWVRGRGGNRKGCFWIETSSDLSSANRLARASQLSWERAWGRGDTKREGRHSIMWCERGTAPARPSLVLFRVSGWKWSNSRCPRVSSHFSLCKCIIMTMDIIMNMKRCIYPKFGYFKNLVVVNFVHFWHIILHCRNIIISLNRQLTIEIELRDHARKITWIVGALCWPRHTFEIWYSFCNIDQQMFHKYLGKILVMKIELQKDYWPIVLSRGIWVAVAPWLPLKVVVFFSLSPVSKLFSPLKVVLAKNKPILEAMNWVISWPVKPYLL